MSSTTTTARPIRYGLLALSLTLWSGAIHATDWQPLEGIYALTAEGYLDPATGEPDDSHLRLQLSGRTARDLYRAMKTEAVVDDCTGGLAKNIGEMQCLYFEREQKYDCHFSVRLADQTIDYGVAC